MAFKQTYPFSVDRSGLVYTFRSVGNETLTKKVIFTIMGDEYFNVELRTETSDGLLPDTEVSNNRDAHRVLATVASVIEDFLKNHSATIVHIKGSDDRRQRIYQHMLIKATSEKSTLQAFGVYTNGKLEPLKADILYDACFVINL